MSKIQQFGRPHETFDPSNKVHRKIFHDVLRYRTWGRSPICFWNEEDSSGSNSLMDQCIKAMGRYYMEKEFGELIDDMPFLGKDQTRNRANPHVYHYTRKKTLT
jgi:hypothetical protein